MSGAIYQGAAGAIARQYQLDIISNNLANANTVGFKKDRAVFRIDEADFESPEAAERALTPAMLPFNSHTDYAQGPFQITEAPLDVGLDGDGFFSVQTPDGVQYTRKGHFMLDAEGTLITPDGYPVLGDGGPITIEDGGDIVISAAGDVVANGEVAGTLSVVDFPKPYALQKTTDNLFVPFDPNVVPGPAENTRVVHGVLERANTEVISEMTRMISAHRLFETYQKVIQSVDQMDEKAVNELGRTA